MTKKEMNLRIFEGEDVPHVFFQPRVEPWYAWHKEFGRLPSYYSNMSLLELYDELGISMRYCHYYTGMPDPIETSYSDEVKIEEKVEGDQMTTIFSTPCGELVQKSKLTVDRSWRILEFAGKGREDLKKLKWLFENMTYHFNEELFEQGSRFIGHRGEPQFWVPKSPYQMLSLLWMGLEDFIYALADAPRQMHDLMAAVDDSYDPLYEEIIAYGKVHIVNFGENIHATTVSPRYFEEYLIPFFEKRSTRLREARIYTHVHIDGYCEPLLEYFARLPFDGLEALTPLPQGDVTLEQIKEHIADKVLLDGIPAVLFLPHHTREELQECVEKIVELFHPRLVLGISDELPEGAGEEAIARVKWVADYCHGKK